MKQWGLKPKRAPQPQLPKFLDNSLYSLFYPEHRWLESNWADTRNSGCLNSAQGSSVRNTLVMVSEQFAKATGEEYDNE